MDTELPLDTELMPPLRQTLWGRLAVGNFFLGRGGGAFIALAALDLVAPWVGWRLAAAPVALLFVLAQGWVLSNCRGVLAWNVPILPPLFLASARVSGAGVPSPGG